MKTCTICNSPCRQKYCPSCNRRLDLARKRHYYHTKNWRSASALARAEVRSEVVNHQEQRAVDVQMSQSGYKKSVLGNHAIYKKGFESENKDDLESKILRWFAYSKDTGASSCAMMFSFIGHTDIFGIAHPFDSDDFGRCIRALRIDSRLKGMLSTPAKLSPFWEALVKRWGEIEGVYLRDCKRENTFPPNASRTYDLLRSIYEPIKEAEMRAKIRTENPPFTKTPGVV